MKERTIQSIAWQLTGVFIAIIFFLALAPDINALTGYTLIKNYTFEQPYNISNNMSMRDRTTWEIKGSGAKQGSKALHSKQGSSFSWGNIQELKIQTLTKTYGRTILMQGWVMDPISETSNSGGYPMFTVWNTTTSNNFGAGINCENTYAYARVTGTLVQLGDFTADTGPTCGGKWWWLEVIFNTTSNKMAIRVWDDSIHTTLKYSNMTVATLPTYWNKSNLGFGDGRNGYWDGIEVYFLGNISSPPSSPTLVTNSSLRNQSVSTRTEERITYNGTITNPVSRIGNCSLFAKVTDYGEFRKNQTDLGVNVTKGGNFTYHYPFLDDYIYFKVNCTVPGANDATEVYKYRVNTENIFILAGINDTNEVLDMLGFLPIALIYVFVTWLGYNLVQKHLYSHVISGFILLGMSTSLELYSVAYIYDNYFVPGLSLTFPYFVIAGFGLFCVMILVKFVSYFTLQARIQKS